MVTNLNIFLKQTIQYLADSWCNVIGSNSIVVLMAFFDDQPDLRNSDEERINFTKFYLENLCFLYKDSENENKKVCGFNNNPSHLTLR